MSTVNENVLAGIAERNPTAEGFFNYAAGRERNVRENVSNLPQLRLHMSKKGYHAVPQELLSMFRELERAGIGKFRGQDFMWYTSIKEVGERALGLNKAKVVAKPVKIEPVSPIRITSQVETHLTMKIGAKSVTLVCTGTLTKEECQAVYAELLSKASK